MTNVWVKRGYLLYPMDSTKVGGGALNAAVSPRLNPTPRPVPNAPLAGWTLILNEKFAGSTLDGTRWVARSGDSVAVADSSLRLSARATGSGDVRSYPDKWATAGNYFRVEVRASPAGEPGVASSLAMRAIRGGAVVDGEIAFETTDDRVIASAGSSRRSVAYSALGTTPAGWHAYLIEKTPDGLRMSIDGTGVLAASSGAPADYEDRFEEDGTVWGLRCSVTDAPTLDGTSDALVDYVRAWSYTP